jgi:molecular chaperone GrpE
MTTANGNCFYDLEARLSNKEMRAKRLARLKSQNFGDEKLTSKNEDSILNFIEDDSEPVKTETKVVTEPINQEEQKVNTIEKNVEDSERISRELAELRYLVKETPSLEFLKERIESLSPSKVTMFGILSFYRIIVNTLKTSGASNKKVVDTKKIIELESIISNKEKEAFLSKEQLTKTNKELEDSEKRCEKLKADFENFKGRTQQEVKLKTEKAISDIFKKILPIIDNFERAFNASKTSNDKESFSKGVEMILSQFETTLKGFGITKMDPLLKPFDPNVHEALMTEINSNHPDDTVIEVLSNGYMLNDKLLRPASVKVSKQQ